MFQPLLFELARQWRPRAYQTHIAFQDIDKLRGFVQAELAQHASYPRNSWIVGNFEEDGVAFVEFLQGHAQSIRTSDHGAKFIKSKNLRFLPYPMRPIKYRASRLQLEHNGYSKEQGCGNHQ